MTQSWVASRISRRIFLKSFEGIAHSTMSSLLMRTDVSNAESLQNQEPEGLAKKQTSVYSAILDISEAGLQKKLW